MLSSLLLACAPLAAFQGGDIPGYRLYANVSTWNSNEPTANFRTLQAGRLCRLDQRDLVALRGSELWVLADMSTRDKPEQVASGVTGTLLLSGMGPAVSGGNLDALLAITASGVSLWTWNASTGMFVASPLSLSGWAGASELRAGPDGAIFARSAAQTEILHASTAGGIVSAVPHTPPLSVSGPIRDYEAFFWDELASAAGRTIELAVVTDTQILVRSLTNWSGNLLPGNYTVTPNDLVAVSRGTTGERDLLLWYSELNGSGYLAAGNSSRTEGSVPLNATCGAMECFRFGRDSIDSTRQDVFLSLRSSRDVVQLQRLAPALVGYYSFWLPTTTGGELAPNVVENDQELAPAPTIGTLTLGCDVDGDGDDDIISGIHDRNQLQVLLNTRSERFDTVGPCVIPQGLTASGTNSTPPYAGTFSYGRRNAGATHLRLEVRRQLGGGPGVYDPAVKPQWVEGMAVVPVAPVGSWNLGTWDIQLPPVIKGQPSVLQSAQFVLPGNYLTSSGAPAGTLSPVDLLQFTFCEITKDSGGNVTRRFPAATYFCSFAEATEQAYLALREISQYHEAMVAGRGAGSGPGVVGSAGGIGTGSSGGTSHDFATGSGGTVIGGRGLGGGP